MYERTQVFWEWFVANEATLRRNVKKPPKRGPTAEQKINRELSKIHSDLRAYVRIPSDLLLIQNEYPSGAYLLSLELGEHRYPYYIGVLMFLSFPASKLEKWLMLTEGMLAHVELPSLDVWEPSGLKAALSPDDPTVLLIRPNEGFEANTLQGKAAIRATIDYFFGETLRVLYLSDVQVGEFPEVEMDSIFSLFSKYHFDSEEKLRVPFDPYHNLCHYSFGDDLALERRDGTTPYPALIDEALGQSPKHDTNELMRAGIKFVSLRLSYPLDPEEGERLSSRLFYSLRAHILESLLPVGKCVGGEHRDIYHLDLLVADEVKFMEALAEVAPQIPIDIDLIDHTKKTNQLRRLYSTDRFTMEQLNELNAPPSIIISRYKSLPKSEQEDWQMRMIYGRALNNAQDFDTARTVLERCVEEQPDSGLAVYRLGYTYTYIEPKEPVLSELMQYRNRAIELFERMYRLGYRPSEAAAYLAQLHFRYAPKAEQSYFIGQEYLAQAKEAPEIYERYADWFLDTPEPLSIDQYEEIESKLTPILSEVKFKMRISQQNGQYYQILWFAPSPTLPCHLIMSLGTSTMLLSNSDTLSPLGARIEFCIALPADTVVTPELIRNTPWYVQALLKLNTYIINNQDCSIEESDCIDFAPDSVDEVGLFTGVYFRGLKGITRRHKQLSPLTLSTGEQIFFMSVTPIYAEELDLIVTGTKKSIKEAGIMALSPIYDPERENLCQPNRQSTDGDVYDWSSLFSQDEILPS